MPRQTDLESILENISLEFVLSDISDPDSFAAIIPLLKNFLETAKFLNLSELTENAGRAGKIVKSIVDQTCIDIENQFDSLNLIISEMKSLLHLITQMSNNNETGKPAVHEIRTGLIKADIPKTTTGKKPENYSETMELPPETMELPPETMELPPETMELPPETMELPPETMEISPAGENIPVGHSPVSNLFHPGKLPSYLNLEDFAEFLSFQKDTLNKMETLILDIEKNQNRSFAQGELKRIFHTTKGEAGFLGLKDVKNVCHKAEDLMGTDHFEQIIDVLLSVKDWLEATFRIYSGQSDPSCSSDSSAPALESIIELLDAHGETSHAEPDPRQDTVYENITISADNSSDILDMPDVPGTHDIPEQNSIPSAKVLPPSAKVLPPFSSEATPTPPILLAESINVDALRLDKLVEIIGEIAIAESMVTQSPEIMKNASVDLLRTLNTLHKTTKELQTLGLSLRMTPLKSTFNRMERVVRDLARKTGKKIRFIITGGATELDKNLVDKLGDPLIHIVRNSVDHGIEENPSQRVDAGKPETAAIELRAFHKGGYLYIEVEDDGRGIDRQRLFEKAQSNGLIRSDVEMSSLDNDNLLNMVFHPGLSTAKKVTDVSGRGVGMDVVKKSIEACKGKVTISSPEGKGTTCTIKLPLTLSIIDGLVIRVAAEQYVIPTLSVVTSLKIKKEEVSSVLEQGEMINALGSLIPLFRLSKLFRLEGTTASLPWEGIIVVVEDNGMKTALLADELIGKQNTVIKNLELGMEDVKGISGATVMPDGRVSLILDIAGIVELSKNNETY